MLSCCLYIIKLQHNRTVTIVTDTMIRRTYYECEFSTLTVHKVVHTIQQYVCTIPDRCLLTKFDCMNNFQGHFGISVHTKVGYRVSMMHVTYFVY